MYVLLVTQTHTLMDDQDLTLSRTVLWSSEGLVSETCDFTRGADGQGGPDNRQTYLLFILTAQQSSHESASRIQSLLT